MPLNVSAARWDYTGSHDDALAAQRMVGHCHRMSHGMAGDRCYPQYPDEQALERAVIKYVQGLWRPRSRQQHEAWITIAEIAQSFPPVKRVLSPQLKLWSDLVSIQPMSNPSGNVLYLDTLYQGVGSGSRRLRLNFLKRFGRWLRRIT